MTTKTPRTRLIGIAAELARGPNLDERFDLDDRLPKWARSSVERICVRQRELAIAIRDCSDKMQERTRKLEAVAEAGSKVDLTGGGVIALMDALAALKEAP